MARVVTQRFDPLITLYLVLKLNQARYSQSRRHIGHCWRTFWACSHLTMQCIWNACSHLLQTANKSTCQANMNHHNLAINGDAKCSIFLFARVTFIENSRWRSIPILNLEDSRRRELCSPGNRHRRGFDIFHTLHRLDSTSIWLPHAIWRMRETNNEDSTWKARESDPKV